MKIPWPRLPNPKSHKLSKEQVRELKALRGQGYTYMKLAKYFNISDTGVMYHCNSDWREKSIKNAQERLLTESKTQRQKRLDYNKVRSHRRYVELNKEMRVWQHPNAKTRRVTSFLIMETADDKTKKKLLEYQKSQKDLKLKIRNLCFGK